MGVYLAIFGKVTREKIVKVASTLSSILLLLGQTLAPAEAVWEAEMLELQQGIRQLQATVGEQAIMIANLATRADVAATCSP
jgi:hypothetical protein